VGLVGLRRVLDSAPLEDAVATQDAAVTSRLLGDLAPGNQRGGQATRAVVYGDSAYGTGANLAWLDQH
jgi:hypothetical protein